MEERVVDSKDKEDPAGTNETAGEQKGSGSFWISETALQALIRNRATATQICTYLVLSKHTDAGGKLSTCGVKAVKKKIGIGDGSAKRALAALVDMRGPTGPATKSVLVYQPDRWAKVMKEEMPERPTPRSQVRWVLNDFKSGPESRIWFGNSLVSGHGEFTLPLRRLKQCGDVAARLLLLLYQHTQTRRVGYA